MISVCIATFNGEKYIRQQLDSIFAQSLAVDEIIISDDSSTDKTLEIIKEYKDPRIQLIENQTFKNPVFNLENALKRASGDFIFFADQDDIWEPEKVECSVKYLNQYDLVMSNCSLIDENNREIAPSFFDLNKSGKGFIKNIYKNTYSGCCMAITRELKEKVLPFPKKIAMHDMWIGLNAELFSRTKIYFLPKPLVKYRRHDSNKTPIIGINNNNTLYFKFKYRVQMLFLVVRNYIQKKYICRKSQAL